MTIHNLDKCFNPESVAVIGASERSASVGAHLMKNLIDGGYKGVLLPVNPQYRSIMGLPAFPSVDTLPHDSTKPIDRDTISLF